MEAQDQARTFGHRCGLASIPLTPRPYKCFPCLLKSSTKGSKCIGQDSLVRLGTAYTKRWEYSINLKNSMSFSSLEAAVNAIAGTAPSELEKSIAAQRNKDLILQHNEY